MKHTAAPWHFDRYHHGRDYPEHSWFRTQWIIGSEKIAGMFVATVPDMCGGPEVMQEHAELCETVEANVRLATASPELLKALQAVAARWDAEDEADAPELGAMIRAAISKATEKP